MVATYWAMNWQLKHQVPSLGLTFEREEKIGEFRAVYRDHMKHEADVQPKAAHPEFEAADILAWRHARSLRKAQEGTGDETEFFAGINSQLPQHMCRFLNAEVLRTRFAEFGYTPA
jgi:hypothetical protein